MLRRTFVIDTLALLLAEVTSLAGCATSGGDTREHNAMRRREIDFNVNGTLSRLFRMIPGSRNLIEHAKGVLVFPSVAELGVGVSGQYGDGGLKIDDKIVGYYNIVSASIGFQFGTESRAIIFIFADQDQLDRVRQSAGWNATGSVLSVTADGKLDADSARVPVGILALTYTGIVENYRIGLAKVSKLDI